MHQRGRSTGGDGHSRRRQAPSLTQRVVKSDAPVVSSRLSPSPAGVAADGPLWLLSPAQERAQAPTQWRAGLGQEVTLQRLFLSHPLGEDFSNTWRKGFVRPLSAMASTHPGFAGPLRMVAVLFLAT